MSEKPANTRKSNTGLRRPSVLAWLRLMRSHHRVLQAAGGQPGAWGLSNAQFDVLAQVGAAEAGDAGLD